MAEKKTIALCLEYPLALRGGVSVLVETLLEGLKDRYQLILVSPDEPDKVPKFLAGHVYWNPATVSSRASEELAQELARRGVQLAHFHLAGNYGFGNRFPGCCPIHYLDKLGMQAVSTVHLVVSPLDGYCWEQRSLWFKLALFPLAWAGKMQQLANVRFEIAVSKHDEEKLRRWYWPLRKKFVQIYHSRIPQNQEIAAAEREPLVLNVGHIAWRKGQLVLAEAFARVAPKFPEWKLSLQGAWFEADIVDKIRAVAKANRIEDRILLPGERSDAMDWMKRAGIYVQPSYREALGLALQEAMFVGCPSIGSRVGGIPELIEDEKTGLLVDAGDVEQLARALERLMSDVALREKLGRQGAESIIKRKMTADAMVAAHIELYERALRDKGS